MPLLSARCTDLQSRTPGGGVGRHLYLPDALNNRQGPQEKKPCKCLNGWSYGERLDKEAFWLPATRGSKKDSDRAITPAEEAVHVPAPLVPPGSPQARQLCYLHAQLSLGQSSTGKKMSWAYAHRITLVEPDSLRPCGLWPANLLCQGGGVLQARILEHIGQYWLPYPSRALYFLLP